MLSSWTQSSILSQQPIYRSPCLQIWILAPIYVVVPGTSPKLWTPHNQGSNHSKELKQNVFISEDNFVAQHD